MGGRVCARQIGAAAFAMDSAEVLCEAMADDDGDIRWAATNLMVRLGHENLAEIGARLLKLAAGSDRNARKMALYCIRDLELARPGAARCRRGRRARSRRPRAARCAVSAVADPRRIRSSDAESCSNA